MAIRAGTARSLVLYLEMGMPLRQAARKAMSDLRDLGGDYIGRMNLIALDREGNHIGLSSDPERTYIYQRADMAAHEEVVREVVEIPARWG